MEGRKKQRRKGRQRQLQMAPVDRATVSVTDHMSEMTMPVPLTRKEDELVGGVGSGRSNYTQWHNMQEVLSMCVCMRYHVQSSVSGT